MSGPSLSRNVFTFLSQRGLSGWSSRIREAGAPMQQCFGQLVGQDDCKEQTQSKAPARQGLYGLSPLPLRAQMSVPYGFAATGNVSTVGTLRMLNTSAGHLLLPMRRETKVPTFTFGAQLDVQKRNYMTEGQMLGHQFLLATDIMFWTGLIGAVLFRRNLIVMLLATEIVMLACNLNFLFASAYLNDMTGVIMSITITTIAACETAIGLALCVTYFHLRSATDVEALNLLK